MSSVHFVGPTYSFSIFLWYLLLYLIMKKFKFRLIFLVFYVEAQVDPKMGISQSIIMHPKDLKELINSSRIVKGKKKITKVCNISKKKGYASSLNKICSQWQKVIMCT
jgi:hypothetical protein